MKIRFWNGRILFFCHFFFHFLFFFVKKCFIAGICIRVLKKSFLRSRCSMEMWCPDDTGRDSWDWVGPPAWGRACFNSPEWGWRLLACFHGASPDCIIGVVVCVCWCVVVVWLCVVLLLCVEVVCCCFVVLLCCCCVVVLLLFFDAIFMDQLNWHIPG